MIISCISTRMSDISLHRRCSSLTSSSRPICGNTFFKHSTPCNKHWGRTRTPDSSGWWIPKFCSNFNKPQLHNNVVGCHFLRHIERQVSLANWLKRQGRHVSKAIFTIVYPDLSKKKIQTLKLPFSKNDHDIHFGMH